MSGVSGLVSRFSKAVATPLLPSDYLDLFAPLHNPNALRGKVVSVRPETADSVTLEIKPGVGWKHGQPGQYVRIGVDVDGVRLWRAYSLTSGPRRDGRFTVTVKAIPDGAVSRHIVRDLQPGTIVQLDNPTGDFTLPAILPPKMLFVTAGSGITPVMGMLRWIVVDATPNYESISSRITRDPDLVGPPPGKDIVVVHAAPTRGDVIFGAELRELARDGLITLIESHDEVDGFLTQERLVELVPDLAHRETWACGPTPLLDLVEDLYADKGLADQLHTERFRPTIVVPGEGGEVSFTRSGKTVEVDGSETVLAAAEADGVVLPYGCRMGICMGCKVPLVSGAVRDLRNGELTVADDDPIHIQTCISSAAGACTIQA